MRQAFSHILYEDHELSLLRELLASTEESVVTTTATTLHAELHRLPDVGLVLPR
jgi:hypothetical protein